ncbi:MAG TPA: mitochondrial fission ELM1 family protein [Azospirillaceae bacterium]|nr:mitochondrial fission ELM1 family protein [Azospirillaceae bacterium]
MQSLTCWVVTEGAAGMENQCLGLAEALGLDPVVKRVRLRAPWRQLVPYLRWGLDRAAGPAGDPIAPPWPDLVISCGRQGAGVSAGVRRLSGGRTFTVHIQDPQVSTRHFDLIVAPEHDRLTGSNVVVTRGALHRVTQARLAADAARAAPRVAHLPSPRVAVLIGGSNAVYRLTPEIIADVADKLAALSGAYGAGLLVTPSRRTDPAAAAVLRRRLAGLPAEIWDGNGENPYFAYLGLADAVVVTCDSVSMVTEAASTAKPLYVIMLEGGSPKFQAFHEGLFRDGIARPFTGELDRWNYRPIDDMARVVEAVRRGLATKGAATRG